MNLETAFLKIYGREAKPEETNRFNRLAKELDIRENDAIWSIVFLLGHHLELTEAIPEKMNASAKCLLDSFNVAIGKRGEVAETELRAARARIEESVSVTVVASAQREIARAAQTVARHTAAKSWLQWLGSAAIVGMMILASAFYCGYRDGKSVGYASALDLKTAASWAVTPSGQAAYHLDQSGDLIHIIRCDRDGWRVSTARSGTKSCSVRPGFNGEIVGWQVP